MKKTILFLLLMLTMGSFGVNSTNKRTEAGSNTQSNDGYTVDEFYKKVDLDYGTLDESGNPISAVFVKTELDAGKYEIQLSDGPRDLYNITGTKIYITFNGYFGYAGYGTECILKVEYYNSKVYKIE